MRRATLTATALLAGIALTGCSSSKTAVSNVPAGNPTTTAASQAAAPTKAGVPPITAEQVVSALAKAIGTAKQTGVVTAENDGNHLLGRPGQYTSKVDFSDSRIEANNVSGLDAGDVERGGAVEVFATAADAKTRADYIQTVVKNLPMMMEYDYPHGTVLIRVSKFLTPAQAGEYDKAASSLG